MEKTKSSKQIFLIPLCLVFLTTLGSGYIYFGAYSEDKVYLSLLFKSLFLIITLHSLLNYFGSYKRILLHQEQAIQNDYSSTTFLPSLFFALILNSILIFVAYQLISSQLKTGKTLRY